MRPLTPFRLVPASHYLRFAFAPLGRMAEFAPREENALALQGTVPPGYRGGPLRLALPWTTYSNRVGEVAWHVELIKQERDAELTVASPEKPAVIASAQVIKSVFWINPAATLSEDDTFLLRICRDGSDPADTLAGPACIVLESLRLEELSNNPPDRRRVL